jgi:hypothetical protein
MSVSLEDLLVANSHMCNALGDLMVAWHQRADPMDSETRWMELVEPLAGRIGFASASLENLVAGTTRGGFTDRPVIFPDLASIYTIARSQLEAYLNFYYLYIGPQSDEERKLKYNIYVVAGLTVRQAARPEFEELYKETQDPQLLPLIAQIHDEAERIAQLRTQIEADPLFNTRYSRSQRANILSLTQPRARTQSWPDIIKASPLSTASFARSWNLYSSHAHSEYISMLQLSQYTMDVEAHDSYTRRPAMRGAVMVLSTFIGQFVEYMHLQDFYDELHPDLRAMIEYWQQAGRAE